MRQLAVVLAMLGVALVGPDIAGNVARADVTDGAPPRTAMLFEARLAITSPISVAAAGSTAANVTAVPALLLGARLIDRLHVGLGLSFFVVYAANGSGGFLTSDLVVVSLAPTVGIDLLRSRSRRATWYLKAALPLGPVLNCTGPMGQPCDRGFAVGFDVALGARYAFDRVFALGMEAGTSGSFVNPQRAMSQGILGAYGGLVATFYWARERPTR